MKHIPILLAGLLLSSSLFAADIPAADHASYSVEIFTDTPHAPGEMEPDLKIRITNSTASELRLPFDGILQYNRRSKITLLSPATFVVPPLTSSVKTITIGKLLPWGITTIRADFMIGGSRHIQEFGPFPRTKLNIQADLTALERKGGHVVTFQFTNPTSETMKDVKLKLGTSEYGRKCGCFRTLSEDLTIDSLQPGESSSWSVTMKRRSLRETLYIRLNTYEGENKTGLFYQEIE